MKRELVVRLASPLLIGWMTVAIAAGAHVSSDPIQLAEEMRQSQGDEYLAARDQILTLPRSDIDDAIAHLQSDPEDVVAEVLGYALQYRADHPEVALEVEQTLQWSIDNPRPTRHPEILWYAPGVPLQPSDRDVLYYEIVLRYDVPLGLRASMLSVLGNATRLDHPLAVKGHLAVIESDLVSKLKRRVPTRLASAAALHPDDRVVPALVRLHEQFRLSGLDRPLMDPGAGRATVTAAAFGRLGTLDALLAVEHLFEFEQGVADELGFAPWDDPSFWELHELTTAAINERWHAQQQAKQEGRELTAEEVEVHEEQILRASRRRTTRVIWERLEQSRQQILERLQQQE